MYSSPTSCTYYDVIIVGGGLVGLASAYALLALPLPPKILLLEKESRVAQHQSKHNSGVMHSGIYYLPDSKKAKNCLSGYQLLRAFCDQEGIPYTLSGKLIVAARAAELPYLKTLYQRGRAHALQGLRFLHSQEEMHEYEPHIRGLAGLWVPQAGIIDYEQVARRLQTVLAKKDVQFRLGETLCDARQAQAGRITLHTSSGSMYETNCLINCAGLYADRVMRLLGGRSSVRILPFRGEYYTLNQEAQSWIRGLVYPVPDPRFPFLGVHFTRNIKQMVEAGPNAVLAWAREGYRKSDVQWQDIWEMLTFTGFYRLTARYFRVGMQEWYRSYSKAAFLKALQVYLPQLESQHLESGGSGVRAQACDAAGRLVDDFHIVEERAAIHVCNAPSPAATASLAIGKYIASRVQARM